MNDKEYLLRSEKTLIFSSETLLWHVKQLLIHHPEIISETCKECSSKRTCANSVEIAMKQLKDVLYYFKE